MVKTSLVAFGIVLASGGLALAQQSSQDTAPPSSPPGPAGHHQPPPPGGPAALQGKGFDLELGHGQGLRVQCGDEQLKSCIQAAQPLIHQLEKSSRHGGGHGMSWKHHQKPMGQGSMGRGSMDQGSTDQGSGLNQDGQPPSGSSATPDPNQDQNPDQNQNEGSGMGQTPSDSTAQPQQSDKPTGQVQ